MSKKTVILTITPIIVLGILASILAVIIINKIEKADMEEKNYEKIIEKSEVGKKINELCASVEYRPYNNTHVEYTGKLEYPNNGITFKEEGFFSAGDWLCTFNSVDANYIGKYIGTGTSEYTDKEYEVYEIRDVSSEYAVAYKDTDLDCYMGLINRWYQPESLQMYIDDLNIINNDVEIIISYNEKSKDNDEEKLMWVTFIADDNYLFNEFFKNRKYVRRIGRGINSSEEITVMSICLYQKELKHKIYLDVGLNGSISTDGMDAPSLFSGSADATLELLEYMSENYEGYKEESIETDNLPILGDKNEFLGK